MNIGKKLLETEKFDLEYQGEKVTFTAKKASLTPGFLSRVGSVVSYPKAVADTLTDWDVFWDEAEAHKVELSEEELSKLPVSFLDAVLSKIADSWAVNEKKAKASSSGSQA